MYTASRFHNQFTSYPIRNPHTKSRLCAQARRRDLILFANTESGEDTVGDVFADGLAGELAQCAHSFFRLGQQPAGRSAGPFPGYVQNGP